MTDYDFIVQINPLIDSDNTIFAGSTFKSPANSKAANTNAYQYALASMELHYSIISSSAPGTILLFNPYPILSNNRIQEGQIVLVSKVITGGETSLIYVGFVKSVIYDTSINGTYITLLVDTLLSQLMQLPMVQNQEQANQYGQPILDLSSQQVTQKQLFTGIAQNSLLQLASTEYVDYSDLPYPPFRIIDGTTVLPDKMWAIVQLNESRDAVLREILTPYNRILWQDVDGTINIQPLFTNDTNTNWNVSYKDNDKYPAKYERLRISNNAGYIVNQITQFFGVPNVGIIYQPTAGNVEAVATPNTVYFPRVEQLRTSGYFNTGILQYKAISNDMMKDSTLVSYLSKAANGSYVVGINGQTFAIPQLYANNTMALELVNAYNVSITYPFKAVMNFDLPLAQIITIDSAEDVLPNNNLVCFGGVLSYKMESEGTILTLNYAPVYSISGIWDTLA